MRLHQLVHGLSVTLILSTFAFSPPLTAGGNLFVMTNGANDNAVVRYHRKANGTLDLLETVPTGGIGSGGAPSSSLFGAPVPLTADGLGSQGSLVYDPAKRRLVGVNAGSDEVFCMRIVSRKLKLFSNVNSGGSFPVSVSMRGDVVYVLNAGGLGSIQGFRIKDGCRLVKQSQSSETLASLADPFNLAFQDPNPVEVLTGAAQISISPDGTKLVISYKGGLPNLGGAIIVYSLRTNAGHRLNLASRVVTTFGPFGNGDAGPFGFSWAGNGDLLVNHVNDSSVAAYQLNGDNTLTRMSGPISVNTTDNSSDPTGGVFNCWSDVLVVNGETWFYSSVFGHIPATNGGDPDGPGQLELFSYDHATQVLTRVGNVATYLQIGGVGNHAIDLKIVSEKTGSYLYAMEPRFGRLAAYRILADGSLGLIWYEFDGLDVGIDPYAGSNPGIEDYVDRCFLDSTPAPECEKGSIQGIAGN